MKHLKSTLIKVFSSKAFKRIRWYLTSEQPDDDRFFDLAPVDNADRDGLYGKALDFAMQNSAIRNIALTGPYGSGKTSVIKTYEKNTHYRFLNVSLATFSDPNLSEKFETAPPSGEDTVKIERSILQQMLYGTDSGTLPYSRFKRISKPRWPSTNAINFTFWVVACGYLYREKEEILSIESIENLKLLWVFVSLYVAAYFAQLVSRALKASHSLSVKRLSLQNGEVELDQTPESSILNKYLDEILYFFEENDYDAVIFEDLDRFGSPEIFIKLREINKIINDRPKRSSVLHKLKISQPLKFLYAIKDDVFLNKDRAKFFDFITPVIPIINNSNSREMFVECIAPKDAEVKINSRFLSEVSLYLDDFRLIKNISNEFLVYRGKVGGDPNLDKLLAMIVYKNTYPKDFEELHHGKGALYNVVQQRITLISNAAAQIDEKIESHKKLIISSESELCSAAEDLARIFWGQLCGGYQEYYIKGIYLGESVISFEELLDWENFRRIFNEKNIRIQAQVLVPGYNQMRLKETSIGCSFRELEEAASPGLKFEARYERIKNKNLQRRNQLNIEIETFKEVKSEIARKPLRDLMKDTGIEVHAIALDHGIGDSRLLNYLIRNGYLDETYHLYISIFHEGRMSRNDWNFIQAIRDFRSLDPNVQIDTPKEVIAEMRDEDFGAEYVLNVALVDHLLTTLPANKIKLQSAIGFISRRFADSEEFFRAYWISGNTVDKFTQALSENWPEYASVSISSDQAAKHVARIISYVSPSYVAKQMNTASGLAHYLSQNAYAVFSENLKFASGYESLKRMSVKISDIHAIEMLDELLAYVYEHSLYSLSIDNVSFVLSKFPNSKAEPEGMLIDCRLANYTAIMAHSSQPLIKYVTENIDYYLDSVALAIDSNVDESKDSILEIINHPDVDSELATQFALKQTHIFNDFERIPSSMRDEIFFNGRIAINWENIISYFSQEDRDWDRLIKKLDSDGVATELSKFKIRIPEGDTSAVLELCRLLISNITIKLVNFQKICASIPYHYKQFPPGLPVERRMVLTNHRIVRLNEESFLDTSDSPELRAALIRNNFDLYMGNSGSFPLEMEVKTLLLSTVHESKKNAVIKKISVEELQSSPKALREVSKFLATPGLLANGFNREVAAYCLANAVEHEIDIGILINFVGELTDHQITTALKTAPEPYCNFIKANARQKIDRTERHLEFIRVLERRGIVSSISDDGVSIRVNAYRKGFLN
ncbi:hypothetical protein ACQKIK_15810 [Pseudomonas sp. NPDC047961]